MPIDTPSITPAAQARADDNAASVGGTTFSTVELTASRCSAIALLAWYPAHRAKKSDSRAVALMVSMPCTPVMAVDMSLPFSCSIFWLSSARVRAMNRSSRRFTTASDTPIIVSVGS